MNCSNCSQQLRENARFCDQCGQRVPETCSACGHPLRDGARFCDQCGAQQSSTAGATATAEPATPPSSPSIPASRPAERRQLTVMFCDLVASTQLAHRLDAESLREVVAAYQDHASQVLSRYEAHIAQYLGDGILVYFGYPRAHENDAERAIRAGWEILEGLADLNTRLQAEYQVALQVRLGVHTGTVVVGEVGDTRRKETLALGATIHVAARLEGFAEPDTIAISGETLKLVDGLFEVTAQGTPALKGVEEPIPVYTVTNIRPRRSSLPLDDMPITGRERELERLNAAWTQVESGHGQVVLIHGEPGFGKSRLVQALAQELTETSHFWIENNGSTFTQNSAFAPMIALLEEAIGLRSDPPERALSKLEDLLNKAGMDLPANVPLLADLLSLPLPEDYHLPGLSSAMKRQRTIQAVIDWIHAVCQRRPTVLLVEDLQWFDPSTIECIQQIEETVTDHRLLILLTSRDGYAHPWFERAARGEIEAVALERLDQPEARQMIDRLRGNAFLPETVIERLIERADGIPLYLEELTKMALESSRDHPSQGRTSGAASSLEEFGIPSTLRDSLTARIDRLGAARGTAQIGAVFGRQFHYRQLAEIATSDPPLLGDALDEKRLRGHLDRLVDSQLLLVKGHPPNAAYTFKHALLEDVAYQGLLRKVRQDIHGRIARLLSAPGNDKMAPPAEVIARHFKGAALWFEAASALLRAGIEAAERAANTEAVHHLDDGLQMLQKLGPDARTERLELSLQTVLCGALATSRGYGHPDVGQAVDRTLELFRRSDLDGSAEAYRALMLLWTHHFIRADFQRVAELTPQLLEGADQEGGAYEITQAHGYVGSWHYFQGDFATASQFLERAIQVYNAHRSRIAVRAHQVEPGVFAHAYRAFVLLLSGRSESGLAHCQQAVELARESQQPLSLAFALFMSALFPQVLGDPELVRPAAEESKAFSTDRGFPFYQAMSQAVASINAGRDVALQIWRRAVGHLEAMGTGVALPTYCHMLAEVCITTGHLEEAEQTLEKAETLAAKGQKYADAERYRVYGLLQRARGQLTPAAEHFERAIEIAREQGALLYELRSALPLAECLRDQGQPERAIQVIEDVRGRFTEGFEAPDLRTATALLASLRSLVGG